MAHYLSDNRHKGEERLVISFDIGTTNSERFLWATVYGYRLEGIAAVSFAHLYPGARTEVKLVNKWPGQPVANGNCKIPSIIAYQNGHPVEFGAEAEEYLDDDDYQIARWFKLHLHPDSMKVSDMVTVHDPETNGIVQIEIPPLPPSTNLLKVYADFMEYLYDQTRLFIYNNMPNGHSVWDWLEKDAVIVMATPNGWDTSQHLFLRKAAVLSGMVDEHEADIRLTFVTEGEASVHYALAHHQSGWLQKGTNFIVTDAGGSTVDSTLYQCKAISPSLALKELRASECVQAGGVFLDRNAGILLRKKLALSKFNEKETIGRIVEEFEKKTKRLFDGSQKSNIIHFGRSSDNDISHGVHRGRLILSTLEVWAIFDGVIRRIVNSCSKLLHDQKVEYLILTGGFGESPYLRKRLEEVFGPQGTRIVTVDEPSKKAAAEGATIWFIKKYVVARAMRFTFGTAINVPYNKYISSHRSRLRHVITEPDGTLGIPGGFGCLLKKHTVISDEFTESHPFAVVYEERPDETDSFEVELFSWRGEGCPDWIQDENGKQVDQMQRLCVIKADLSRLVSSLQVEEGVGGRRYWETEFSVVIRFGGTLIKAFLEWEEEGKMREGPVTILPNSTFEVMS